MPSVTAILTTRNRPAWAVEATLSILAQTRRPDEIVVADDGDGASGRGLADRFGLTVTFTGGKGPAAARNAAASLAGGDWLAFCDDDDTWLPDRLAVQLAAVQPDDVLLYGDARRSDGTFELAGRRAASGLVFDDLLLDNWIPTSTVLLRREAFERAGGFAARFSPAEDYRLWLHVSRAGNVRRIEQPLATYRLHAGQLQTGVAAMAGASADAIVDALAEAKRGVSGVPGLARRLRQLRFVQGRALARGGARQAARRAYLAAWRYQPWYAKAPLFYLLSFWGR